jgi:thioredoxin reductase (NADPH)
MDGAREVDLLVVGAGPAGMAAALFASLEGLDVLLAEQSD